MTMLAWTVKVWNCLWYHILSIWKEFQRCPLVLRSLIFGFYFFFLFEREKKWEERESERGRITLILSFQSQLSFNWQANTNQCPKNYSCCITIFEVEKWDIENNSFIVCSPFSLTGSTSSNFYSLKLTFKELDSDIHSWNIKFRNEK